MDVPPSSPSSVAHKITLREDYVESVISSVICSFFIVVSYGEIKK